MSPAPAPGSLVLVSGGILGGSLVMAPAISPCSGSWFSATGSLVLAGGMLGPGRSAQLGAGAGVLVSPLPPTVFLVLLASSWFLVPGCLWLVLDCSPLCQWCCHVHVPGQVVLPSPVGHLQGVH